MAINLNSFDLQFSQTQALAIFWAIAVILAFNLAYLLFVWDRRRSAPRQTDIRITRARVVLTVLIGSLVVIGTYANVLAAKTFEMTDCLLLALVSAHGWMAEDLVQGFLDRARQPPPSGD